MGISRTAFLVSFSSIIFFSLNAEATTTFVSVSGASKWSGATDTVKARVVGGVVLNSPSSCSSSTDLCNSCDGSGSQFATPCNPNGVSTSTTVVLTAHTDTTALAVSTNTVSLKSTSGTAATVNISNTSIGSGGDFTATTTWGDICTAIGYSGCSTSFSGTFQLGIGTSSTATEYVEFTIALSVVDASSNAHSAGNSGDGFIGGLVRSGDEKVYVRELSLAGNTVVARGVSDLKYSALIVYYSRVQASSDTPATVFSTLRNNSESQIISYDNSQNPPSVDAKVDGLENGVQYCFVIANQDESGNIYNFMPFENDTTTYSADHYCATPFPVVGLLDDKKCFIATAAYGSPIEPHVKTLRAFRDQYLKTNAPGRAFVEFYYRWSPPFARWIARHEAARAAVRGVLWPLVGVADVGVNAGPLALIGVLFAVVGLAIVGVWLCSTGLSFARSRRRGSVE